MYFDNFAVIQMREYILFQLRRGYTLKVIDTEGINVYAHQCIIFQLWMEYVEIHVRLIRA